MRYEASAGVSNGDIVWDSHFNRFAFTRLDDSSCVSEVQGQGWSGHLNLRVWLKVSHRSTGIGAPRLNDELASAWSPAVRLVSAASLPPDVEMAAGWDACMASVARPATQARINAFMDLGFHKPGDLENRIGYYLEKLYR
jgi:hypothetical protein